MNVHVYPCEQHVDPVKSAPPHCAHAPPQLIGGGVGAGVGLGVGANVGLGVGAGVGLGVGASVVTVVLVWIAH